MPAASNRKSTNRKPPLRRALLVTGMHRSGTSAMTRMLSLSGAGLPSELMPALQDNPTGFWESRLIADFNDTVLTAMGSSWDDVFGLRLGIDPANFAPFEEHAAQLLENEFGRASLIVLKDPRTSLLLPLWAAALQRKGYATHAIVMVRDPREVAASLAARDGFPSEKSQLVWLSYMLAAERGSRDLGRTFVTFDQLLGDWRNVRGRIGDDAALDWPSANPEHEAAIDEFLARDLRHHDASTLTGPEGFEKVHQVYRALLAASDGGAADPAPFNEAGRWLLEMGVLIQPVLADLRGRNQILTSQVLELNDAHGGARGQADACAEKLGATQALLVSAETALDEFQRDLEIAIQRVEATTDRRLEASDREMAELHERLAAERERADLQQSEADLLTKVVNRLRGELSTAVAKLGKFDERLDAAQDEFEVAMQTLEVHADRKISEAKARIAVAEQRAAQADEAQELRSTIDKLSAELQKQTDEAQELRSTVDKLSAELQKLRASRSWRMTAPLRRLSGS